MYRELYIILAVLHLARIVRKDKADAIQSARSMESGTNNDYSRKGSLLMR
jgi:hypothetical protein